LLAWITVSCIGGAVTRMSVHDWYQELNKPLFTPPDWLFAPVWIALYFSIGVSGWRVWWREKHYNRRGAMTVFGVQLALNLAWSLIFFGAKSIGWAAIELMVLWTAIVINLRLFWKIDRLADSLLIPYLFWTSFALALNISIYMLN
jgi:benzodiazapine receptor